MNKTINRTKVVNKDYTTSKYTLKVNKTESEHVIVPVIMMVPGVHAGSHGALLHTAEGLASAVADWNEKPVVISHPQDEEGNYVSAYTEGVVAVGIITNCRFEDGKLRADLVLNAAVLKEQSLKAYTAITAGQAMEVSIGAYSEETAETGEYNGEKYVGVCTAYTPDHLAILPNQIGACSWDDGCGIRVNHSNQNNTKGETKMERNDLIKALVEQGFQVNVSETGMKETLDKMYNLIWSMDNDLAWHYLEEVYDAKVIYRREPRNNGSTRLPVKYYEQAYSIAEDGSVMLEGEPTLVQKTTSYKPIQINEEMTNVETKVNELIANAASGFTECDRQWLLTQSVEVLEGLEKTGKIIQVNTVEKPAEITADTVREFLANSTSEEVMAVVPEAVKTEMVQGMKMYAAKRQAIIEGILTQSKGVWEEADLRLMTMAMLEKVNKTQAKPVDYSGAVPAPIQTNTSETDGIEPLIPII